jgi:hypothetical protein
LWLEPSLRSYRLGPQSGVRAGPSVNSRHPGNRAIDVALQGRCGSGDKFWPSGECGARGADVERPQAAVGDELRDLPPRLRRRRRSARRPARDGASPSTSVPAARATCTSRINSCISYANAEKVVKTPRKPLTAPTVSPHHDVPATVGAQNAFAAVFHSRRRWAMSWARSSSSPPSSTWRSEGSARR